MITPAQVKTAIETQIPGSRVEVQDLTGGGDHYQVLVVSDRFAGKGLVQQHQMVYAAVREEMDSAAIHALALKTFTPEAWEKAARSA